MPAGHTKKQQPSRSRECCCFFFLRIMLFSLSAMEWSAGLYSDFPADPQIRSVDTDNLLQGPGGIVQPAGTDIIGFALDAGPSQESLKALLHLRDPGIVGMSVQMNPALPGASEKGPEIMAEHQILFFSEGPDRDLPVV